MYWAYLYSFLRKILTVLNVSAIILFQPIQLNTYTLTFVFVAELLLSTPHYSEGDSVHATPKFAQISKYLP